jgi:hypothetical protein
MGGCCSRRAPNQPQCCQPLPQPQQQPQPQMQFIQVPAPPPQPQPQQQVQFQFVPGNLISNTLNLVFIFIYLKILVL